MGRLLVGLLSAVVLLCAAATADQDPSCACDKDADPTVLIQRALAEKEGLITEWGNTCVKERAETKVWMGSVDPAAANAARDARMADKNALSGALEDRIGGLAKFLAELKGILANLGMHIARVNKVYADKYQANLNDQTAASAALHDLSLDFAAPHNVRMNPIENVKGFEGIEEGDAAGGEAAAAAAEVSFLSVAELDVLAARGMGALKTMVHAQGPSRLSRCCGGGGGREGCWVL